MQTKQTLIGSAIVAVLATAAGGYYYWRLLNAERGEPAPALSAPETAAPAEPVIRHPLPEAPRAEPLPALAESDGPLQSALASLVGREAMDKWFNVKSLARRVVVTVDNLPRRKVPAQYNVAKPAPGSFTASANGEKVTLNPDNFRRYTPYVSLIEAIDTEKLVSLYLHFYPLFREEYQNLGYPTQYFNDRVVQAIDDLLAAPEVNGPVELVRPNVLYQYADPDLESRSAGQKILIRMGGANAARIKAKLKEIRSRIASRP